jgi:DNA-binding XRE family transcriptional regulator
MVPIIVEWLSELPTGLNTRTTLRPRTAVLACSPKCAACWLLSGMSQAETAALAGISRHALSNLETGLSQPQLRTALALCRALGQTDPRVLFPGLDVADG